MKNLLKGLIPVLDLPLSILVVPSAIILKGIRRLGIWRLPFCRRVLLGLGVYPLRNHYYEPLFDTRSLKKPLDEPRPLPGIDWNTNEQLELLRRFRFNEELRGIPDRKVDELTFHFGSGAFGSGDAEYLYNFIRDKKPRRIVEVGSGNSTLMALKAIARNREEQPGYECRMVCIEPYEMPWLEKTGIEILRRRVEDIDLAFFSQLDAGDLLFIDSSHMIRPQGDVLFEYLELLPALKPGVFVHVHDIFSPRDYPKEWLVDQIRFWNEQYLLEAFLTHNREWKVIGALNFLRHNHFELLQEKCPYLTRDHEPGSFYIQKIGPTVG